MKEGNVIHLNLDESTLYGDEIQKSDLIISSIITSIRKGDNLPIVEICKFRSVPNAYLLRGGHHRAISHYIEGVILACKLVLPEIEGYPTDEITHWGNPTGKLKYTPIPDVQIVDDASCGYDNLGLLACKKNEGGKYRAPTLTIPHGIAKNVRKLLHPTKHANTKKWYER